MSRLHRIYTGFLPAWTEKLSTLRSKGNMRRGLAERQESIKAMRRACKWQCRRKYRKLRTTSTDLSQLNVTSWLIDTHITKGLYWKIHCLIYKKLCILLHIVYKIGEAWRAYKHTLTTFCCYVTFPLSHYTTKAPAVQVSSAWTLSKLESSIIGTTMCPWGLQQTMCAFTQTVLPLADEWMIQHFSTLC